MSSVHHFRKGYLLKDIENLLIILKERFTKINEFSIIKNSLDEKTFYFNVERKEFDDALIV